MVLCLNYNIELCEVKEKAISNHLFPKNFKLVSKVN